MPLVLGFNKVSTWKFQACSICAGIGEFRQRSLGGRNFSTWRTKFQPMKLQLFRLVAATRVLLQAFQTLELINCYLILQFLWLNLIYYLIGTPQSALAFTSFSVVTNNRSLRSNCIIRTPPPASALLHKACDWAAQARQERSSLISPCFSAPFLPLHNHNLHSTPHNVVTTAPPRCSPASFRPDGRSPHGNCRRLSA